MELYSVIATVALATLAVSYLLLVIAGFRTSLLWGFCNLFVIPVFALPFIFIHWNKAKYAVGSMFIGCMMVGAAVALQSATQEPEAIGGHSIGYGLVRPSAWKSESDLMSEADLQISRETLEQYFVTFKVGSVQESIVDSANIIVLDIVSSLSDASVGDCKKMILDSSSSCEIAIDGCMDDVCLSYLLTSVKGDHEVVHLLGWTLKSKKAKYFHVFEDIRDSFRWTPRTNG